MLTMTAMGSWKGSANPVEGGGTLCYYVVRADRGGESRLSFVGCDNKPATSANFDKRNLKVALTLGFV